MFIGFVKSNPDPGRINEIEEISNKVGVELNIATAKPVVNHNVKSQQAQVQAQAPVQQQNNIPGLSSNILNMNPSPNPAINLMKSNIPKTASVPVNGPAKPALSNGPFNESYFSAIASSPLDSKLMSFLKNNNNMP